jgi:putative sterol carrier protein
VDEIAKKKLKVRVMMQAMLYGLREVAKEDAGVQGQFRGWDRTIQYTVAPDGPHMHLVVAGGDVTVNPGVSDKASATIKFADLDTALALFSRKLDGQAAFMQGKIQLAGEVADAMKMTIVTQLASAYFV